MKTTTITLYDNYNINYEDMYEAFQEWCDDNDINKTLFDEDSDTFHNWIWDTLNIEYDDLMMNIKYSKQNTECVVLGCIGRWNGRFEIAVTKFNTLKDAIKECIYNMDYFIIKIENGVIYVTSIHHDGRNTFEIHLLNKKGCEIQNIEKLDKPCYYKKYTELF